MKVITKFLMLVCLLFTASLPAFCQKLRKEETRSKLETVSASDTARTRNGSHSFYWSSNLIISKTASDIIFTLRHIFTGTSITPKHGSLFNKATLSTSSEQPRITSTNKEIALQAAQVHEFTRPKLNISDQVRTIRYVQGGSSSVGSIAALRIFSDKGIFEALDLDDERAEDEVFRLWAAEGNLDSILRIKGCVSRRRRRKGRQWEFLCEASRIWRGGVRAAAAAAEEEEVQLDDEIERLLLVVGERRWVCRRRRQVGRRFLFFHCDNYAAPDSPLLVKPLLRVLKQTHNNDLFLHISLFFLLLSILASLLYFSL